MASRYLEEIAAIARAHGLNDADATMTREIATVWYFVGPCKGYVPEHERGKTAEIMAAVSQANAATPDEGKRYPRHLAMREMIAFLTISDTGRPSRITCRFAKEMGLPTTRTR